MLPRPSARIPRENAAAIGETFGTARRLRPAERQANAVEVILEKDVHDARDRVRAIDRRRAAGDDLDAFDQVWIDRIEVDRRTVGAFPTTRRLPLTSTSVRFEPRLRRSTTRQGRRWISPREPEGAALLALLRFEKPIAGCCARARPMSNCALFAPRRFGADDADRRQQVEHRATDARAGDDDVGAGCGSSPATPSSGASCAAAGAAIPASIATREEEGWKS